MGAARLTWGRFFGTWDVHVGWTVVVVVLLAAYLLARRAAGGRRTVRGWRTGCWVGGLVVLWVAVDSAIGAYAMALFWMHMVLHLLLIMVVPALLVLGSPAAVALEAFSGSRQDAARRVLRSAPMTVLTHQATGFVVYTAVIVGTHLTDFMDQMTLHPWLMTGEQVLYVVAGWLFLTPLIGEEPLRPNPPYLLRLLILVAAMIPDTLVGIVLLQANTDLFPTMMATHPAWAPDPVSDIQAAGGLMWAGGDGLMMAIAVGLMVSVITSPTRRERMTGGWLEGARRQTFAAHAAHAGLTARPEDEGREIDPDSDEALDAYNRMLAELSRREE